MKVLRAEKMGFCFGVEDAIEIAQQAIAGEQPVYSLGPIIHNTQVIDRLAADGLRTVESVDELGDDPVLIRAHGVDPQTMAKARQGRRQVIDATCVLVRRAQEAVEKLHAEGYCVVIVGDENHPEVKGIVGYAPTVTVIADAEGIDQLPPGGRLGVVAQTTLSQEHFATVIGQMLRRPFREIKVVNTLCLEVLHRQEAAVGLCSRVDVMFVLGGKHSANTQELVHLCRDQDVPTYHLENWDAFRHEYIQGKTVAGVSAGASTPNWVIEQFIHELEALDPGR